MIVLSSVEASFPGALDFVGEIVFGDRSARGPVGEMAFMEDIACCSAPCK